MSFIYPTKTQSNHVVRPLALSVGLSGRFSSSRHWQCIVESLSLCNLAVQLRLCQCTATLNFRGASVRMRFDSPFSSEVVICGHCLVTLSLTINETFKWLSSLSILLQELFWWWQCSDRYTIALFTHLHTPSPFSRPMVSVDVKYHVYLLITDFLPLS